MNDRIMMTKSVQTKIIKLWLWAQVPMWQFWQRNRTAYFNITAPCRGEFGLEIYANDPSMEGQTLYHVAQYMIECHEDVKTVPLPKLPHGYLGPQPKFNDFGLNTLDLVVWLFDN
jgi:hypothetical protein